jgi:hypothetical protein
LPIWRFAAVVLVFAVGFEFDVLCDRKNAAHGHGRPAELVVVAVIKSLGCNIRRDRVTLDSERPFNRQWIAVSP